MRQPGIWFWLGAIFIVIVAAGGILYLNGALSHGAAKRLKLGQTVGTGAFSFTPLRVECGKPISAIPVKQRRVSGIESIHGEICFVPVRLVGPTLHIPPLLVGAPYVGKFVYRSVTNLVNVREATEGPIDTEAIVEMVFAIPKANVPTELEIEGIDQVKAEGPLFVAIYELPS